MDDKCSSCGMVVRNDPGKVAFNCPQCNNSRIVRCGHCRKVVAKYLCHACGFEGPN